jgi:hypothetical protein
MYCRANPVSISYRATCQAMSSSSEELLSNDAMFASGIGGCPCGSKPRRLVMPVVDVRSIMSNDSDELNLTDDILDGEYDSAIDDDGDIDLECIRNIRDRRLRRSCAFQTHTEESLEELWRHKPGRTPLGGRQVASLQELCIQLVEGVRHGRVPGLHLLLHLSVPSPPIGLFLIKQWTSIDLCLSVYLRLAVSWGTDVLAIVPTLRANRQQSTNVDQCNNLPHVHMCVYYEFTTWSSLFEHLDCTNLNQRFVQTARFNRRFRPTAPIFGPTAAFRCNSGRAKHTPNQLRAGRPFSCYAGPADQLHATQQGFYFQYSSIHLLGALCGWWRVSSMILSV